MPKTIKSQKGKNNGHYKHGGKGTKLYEVWCSMKARCYNPTSKSYSRYGGRGITICDEWRNSFIVFKKWAMSHGYKEGLSIDRIDNNEGYSPDNCRWATTTQQANNKRTTLFIEHNGERKTLHEWAKVLGIKPHTLYHRIYKLGWTIERALSEKVSLDRYHRIKGARPKCPIKN